MVYKFLSLIVLTLVTLPLHAPVAAADPVTFTVTSAVDTNDGACDPVDCTLREAIIAANAHVGRDTIAFAIPDNGPHTIRLAAWLPFITEPVIIDGYTQPGAKPNTRPLTLHQGLDTVLQIALDGAQAGLGDPGLRLEVGESIIRGLAIGNFNCGISLTRGPDTRIEGNFLGTDATGTQKRPNLSGICSDNYDIDAPPTTPNTVGGVEPAASNLISAATRYGVTALRGNLVVRNNLLGSDITGQVSLGNDEGAIRLDLSEGVLIAGNSFLYNRGGIIFFDSSNNIVEGNFISGTTFYAPMWLSGGSNNTVRDNVLTHNSDCVQIREAEDIVTGNLMGLSAAAGLCLRSATGTVVQGNFIGTDTRGLALGNASHGILVEAPETHDNLIGGAGAGEGNVIAHNGGAGVFVQADIWYLRDTGNRIAGNAIYGNKGPGIDIDPPGVNPNDEGDADTGPNGRQNYPQWSPVAPSGGKIAGALQSRPATEYTIDFYSNPTCDPSGHGEGYAYLGSQTVTSDATGWASFTLDASAVDPAQPFFTATATDPAGNTSEFSPCSGADLEVTQAARHGAIGPWPNATPAVFVVTVTNAGPWSAADVVVTDRVTGTIPFVARFAASQGSCALVAPPIYPRAPADYDDIMARCELGSLVVGASATITVTVSAQVTGMITNTASVEAAEPDPLPANDEAVATARVGYLGYLPHILRP